MGKIQIATPYSNNSIVAIIIIIISHIYFSLLDYL